jgi:hypothetical protein
MPPNIVDGSIVAQRQQHQPPQLSPQNCTRTTSPLAQSMPSTPSRQARLELIDYWPSPEKSAQSVSTSARLVTVSQTSRLQHSSSSSHALAPMSTFLNDASENYPIDLSKPAAPCRLVQHHSPVRNRPIATNSPHSGHSPTPKTTRASTAASPQPPIATPSPIEHINENGKRYRVFITDDTVELKPPRGASRLFRRTLKPRKASSPASALSSTDRKRRRIMSDLTQAVAGVSRRAQIAAEVSILSAKQKMSLAKDADISTKAYVPAEAVVDIKDNGESYLNIFT